MPRHGARARPTATTAPPTSVPRCSPPARRPAPTSTPTSPPRSLAAAPTIPPPPQPVGAPAPATAARAVVPADRAELAGAHRDPRGDRARARDRRPAVRPVGRGRPPRRRRATPSPARPIPSRSAIAASFDPPCDFEPLHRRRARRRDPDDSDRRLAIDGDPDTAWTTESYDNRDITVLKPGVGLVLTAEQRGELDELIAHQPHQRLVGVASTWPTATPARSRAGASRSTTLEGIEAGHGVDGRPRRGRGRRGAHLDHRPGRRQRRRRGHHRRGRAARACRNSVPLHHRPSPTTRRSSAPPRRATAPPSTRCCAATTTGSTRCAAGWPATRPTRSTPPRRR